MTINETISRPPASPELEISPAAVWADSKPPISVMVVDSQTLFRSGLARLLDDDDRLLVVAASDGHRQLPELCRSLGVDVVVTDFQLPEMDAIELTRMVANVSPQTRMLILAAAVDWRVIPAMAAGAAGFLLKDAEPEAIRSAVVSVHLGEKVLCREAAQWLIEEAPAQRLTRRETEVLRMVAAGADNQEIAAELNIGQKTVRNYVSRLYHKLASQDRAQMATYAYRAGLGRQAGGHVPSPTASRFLPKSDAP
jgi:DNA-binding NarL/FixJ family response regulator